MFIFNRPFRPVAAGLAIPLLFVCLDRSCQPLDATMDRPSVASWQTALVTAHSWLRTTGHDSMQDVIIIGGGPVINALGLAQAGTRVPVIEAEPQIINTAAGGGVPLLGARGHE